MKERIVEKIKPKILELALENTQKLMIRDGVYGNHDKALGKGRLLKKVRIEGEYRKIVGLENYRQESNKAINDMIYDGYLELWKPNCSKIIIKITLEGADKCFDSTGAVIQNLTSIDFHKKNRRKTYIKLRRK